MTAESKSSGRATAVVAGAGIAGLATARVLAERFSRVVVLDRDRLPQTPTSRRGVPQGAHGHMLLAAGGGRTLVSKVRTPSASCSPTW